jgi:hypothetical protein
MHIDAVMISHQRAYRCEVISVGGGEKMKFQEEKIHMPVRVITARMLVPVLRRK